MSRCHHDIIQHSRKNPVSIPGFIRWKVLDRFAFQSTCYETVNHLYLAPRMPYSFAASPYGIYRNQLSASRVEKILGPLKSLIVS